MTSGPTIGGGCQCGAIRYRITLPLGHAGICHCRMCQKAVGNWGAALVSVPEERLAWTRGSPGEFRSSAIVARGFCRDCGTPLYMKEDDYRYYEMTIGSLDNPELAPPSTQVGIESELTWFGTLASLPRKRTEDDRTPDDLKKLKSLQHPDRDTETWPA
jgi:hypothetical protein